MRDKGSIVGIGETDEAAGRRLVAIAIGVVRMISISVSSDCSHEVVYPGIYLSRYIYIYPLSQPSDSGKPETNFDIRS